MADFSQKPLKDFLVLSNMQMEDYSYNILKKRIKYRYRKKRKSIRLTLPSWMNANINVVVGAFSWSVSEYKISQTWSESRQTYTRWRAKKAKVQYKIEWKDYSKIFRLTCDHVWYLSKKLLLTFNERVKVFPRSHRHKLQQQLLKLHQRKMIVEKKNSSKNLLRNLKLIPS